MGEFDRFRLDCDGQKPRTLRRFVEPTQQYPLPESGLTSSYMNKVLLSMVFLYPLLVQFAWNKQRDSSYRSRIRKPEPPGGKEVSRNPSLRRRISSGIDLYRIDPAHASTQTACKNVGRAGHTRIDVGLRLHAERGVTGGRRGETVENEYRRAAVDAHGISKRSDCIGSPRSGAVVDSHQQVAGPLVRKRLLVESDRELIAHQHRGAPADREISLVDVSPPSRAGRGNIVELDLCNDDVVAGADGAAGHHCGCSGRDRGQYRRSASTWR